MDVREDGVARARGGRSLVVALLAWLAACSSPGEAPAPGARAPGAPARPSVVFLVRHAEKVDASADAALSPRGRERAESLAALLADAGLDHVHSTDFARTRETAAPTAAAHGLELELYDPAELDVLAEQIRATGGRRLVVGHSNTTPALVALLGGDPGTPIDEAGEYDRLYVVIFGGDGAASSTLIRYGGDGEAPAIPAPVNDP